MGKEALMDATNAVSRSPGLCNKIVVAWGVPHTTYVLARDVWWGHCGSSASKLRALWHSAHGCTIPCKAEQARLHSALQALTPQTKPRIHTAPTITHPTHTHTPADIPGEYVYLAV